MPFRSNVHSHQKSADFGKARTPRSKPTPDQVSRGLNQLVNVVYAPAAPHRTCYVGRDNWHPLAALCSPFSPLAEDAGAQPRRTPPPSSRPDLNPLSIRGCHPPSLCDTRVHDYPSRPTGVDCCPRRTSGGARVRKFADFPDPGPWTGASTRCHPPISTGAGKRELGGLPDEWPRKPHSAAGKGVRDGDALCSRPSGFLCRKLSLRTAPRMMFETYEGGAISTQTTKGKRKFWKNGDLFLNVVSF